jgi:signal transduction histidine kinase/ligand-binding sensor domain-containing protein/DNA-binding response OmpR family regulator
MTAKIFRMAICMTLMLFSIGNMHAQGIYFEHLNQNDGLSHYTVNSMYQDENGLIWIGTRDGLNRYDGNEFLTFRQQTEDSTGLFANNIRTVCGDKKGFVFLYCKSGAVELNLKTEKFSTIFRKGVTAINYGQENLWIAMLNRIYAYNPLAEEKLHVHLNFSTKGMKIRSVTESSDRILYVGTETNGVMVFDKNKKLVKQYAINQASFIYEDSKKNIWICTRNNGLYRIDFSGIIRNYIHRKNDPESIPDNLVRTIHEDDLGDFWIGTPNGLCRLNVESNTFQQFSHLREASQGISSSSVWSLMRDKQGTLWIGTYFGGIDMINPRYSTYKFFGASMSSKLHSLSSPMVGRIIGDNSGNLWVGTDGGGLNLFNPKTKTFEWFMSGNQNNNLSANTIKSMWIDQRRNNLWIGTHLGGLNKMNLKTRRIQTFEHQPDNPLSIPDNYVRDIIHYNDTLIISTQNSIGLFDLKTETCRNMQLKDISIANKEIFDMLLDTENNLWFSFSNTLVRYSLRTGLKELYRTNNNVTVIYQDISGNIWTGTDGNGVKIYNKSKDIFEPYTGANNILQSRYVIDILESTGGYMYFSTNNGLIITDKADKFSLLLNNKNGFPLIALNENSLYIDDANQVYVGGINGLVSFFEKDLIKPTVDYTINITGLWINNKRIAPGDNSLIDKSVGYLSKITLKPEHSVFTINFSTTNYIRVLKNDMQYQLIGFDKDWIDANYRNNITYTNLNPGTYVLKIRTKTTADMQPLKERQIEIVVLPPFYKTTLAYIIYILLIAAIATMLIRFYTSKVKLSTSLEYEKRERHQTEEHNQSKLRFFTNISHEFRTPLTLIINQIDVILQMGNVPQPIYSRLLNVIRNANRMKKLITELLDFRKFEQGYMLPKVSNQNIVPFLNEIYLSFKELAQSKEINYTFLCLVPELNIWFDENQLDKVFYNLIANAFKYTKHGGTITVKIEQIENEVKIIVEDTGIGIDKQSVKRIFDRFYQAENSSLDLVSGQGSGIGLALAKGIVEAHSGVLFVESEPYKGSCFIVSLKLGDAHFAENQKVSLGNKDKEWIKEIEMPEQEFVSEIIESRKSLSSEHSTILLVEDNEELLQILAEAFSPIYKVITAVDGIDGFEKATENQPDIVLSDVMMPNMSGVEMCSKLKSNFETSHIPVVLLTAQTAADYIVQGLLTGADDYIIKPFNLKVLVARCNNIVNTRKMLQQKFSREQNPELQLIATNSIDQQMIEKATRIVEKHIDDANFEISHFASEMWLSRTNLFNKLKGVTGQTPNDFIITMRLKKSLYLLINSPELAIADVAIQVGFGSTSYFIKKFNKLYGITPAQYRKNSLEQSPDLKNNK